MRRFWILIAILAIGGCEKLARNMYDQPRYKPMRESALFPDGTSARSPVRGTVPGSGARADEPSAKSALSCIGL